MKIQKTLTIGKQIFRLIVFLHIAIFSIVFLFCVVYREFNPPFGALQLYRKYVYHYQIKPVEFVPLKNIPKDFQRMALAVEDYKFYQHKGIDLEAIKTALILNFKMKKQYYGGSTITQQLARTLFLTPQKSFLRKYLEALIAIEMELIIPKDRILELYLNSIEWGKGIFGIERASVFYYNKSVTELSTDEAIRLITILSSPVKYNPDNFQNLKIMIFRYDFLCSYMKLTPGELSNTNISLITKNSNYIGSDLATDENEDIELNETNKIAVSSKLESMVP